MADASESQAVGRTPRAGQDLSSAERNAVAQAMDVLEAHTANPRIAALHSKLNAARNPLDFSGDADADDRVAKALIDVQQLAKSEDTPPALRERAEKAARDLQAAHLDRMGSGHRRVLQQERDRERLAKASLGGRAA